MARKVIQVPVTEAGRDKDKLFQITEMSSRQCEDWAIRVLLAVLGLNPQLPDDFATLGTAALAQLGMKSLAGLKPETLQPILAEMMTCVMIIPDSKTGYARALDDEDIEEVATRLQLRLEVWKLHMGFLKAVIPSVLGIGAAGVE